MSEVGERSAHSGFRTRPHYWPRYPHTPGARPSLLALEALRGTSGSATMTTPVGRAQRYATHCHMPRARRIGFYHGVGAPTGPPYGALTLRFALVSYPTSSVALRFTPHF